MKIQVDGKTFSLTKKDYKAEGGEGQIFVKGGTAFKIYFEPRKMIPVGKIQELSVLDNPKIIKPDKVIFNSGKPIGYTMRFLDKTYSLVQTFTKAFKNRHGLNPDMCLDLIRDMQKTVDFIHSRGILIVDLNEMNFLVDEKFKEIYCIDVDSYQTPSYKATAIMESIRDRHTPLGDFSEGSDWFSFAVVTFQLLIGIHPYKGKHPSIKGLDERMQGNISVFNKSVGIPGSALPIDIIPSGYRNWYKAVFEKGLREAPPFDFSRSIPVVLVAKVITGTDNFEIEELFECQWDIHQYAKFQQTEVIVGDGVCINRQIYRDFEPPFSIGFFGTTPIAAKIDAQDQLELRNLKFNKEVAGSLWDQRSGAEKVMAYDGRIYYMLGDHVYESVFYGSEVDPHRGANQVANVLSNATRFFPGCVVQNLLGTCFVSAFPEQGTHYQYKIEDFKGYRLIDAKFEKGILMLVGEKKGKYDRFVFYLEENKNIPTQMRRIEDISFNGLNFTVLDKGICVQINEEEQVEIFHKHGIMKVKVIEDPVIHSGMRLFNDGSRVLFADGKKLFSLKMKK